MEPEKKQEVLTGFYALDHHQGAFVNGELMVLAAGFETGINNVRAKLKTRSSDMSTDLYEVKTGATYQHYKGPLYIALGLGVNTETNERFVCYRQKDNPELIWIRPITMFFEKVMVADTLVPRFKLIED